MKLGRIITTMAIGGAALALIGTGVASSFTDSATASENISVGTLGITITSSTPMRRWSTQERSRVSRFTPSPTLRRPSSSSAPGSAHLQFTVNNTGTMDVTVSVSSSDQMQDGFTDVLGSPQGIPIAAGGHHDFDAGLQWLSGLTNASLGKTYSITYTITATA